LKILFRMSFSFSFFHCNNTNSFPWNIWRVLTFLGLGVFSFPCFFCFFLLCCFCFPCKIILFISLGQRPHHSERSFLFFLCMVVWCDVLLLHFFPLAFSTVFTSLFYLTAARIALALTKRTHSYALKCYQSLFIFCAFIFYVHSSLLTFLKTRVCLFFYIFSFFCGCHMLFDIALPFSNSFVCLFVLLCVKQFLQHYH
jgi:hypothetical protein